MKRAWIPVLAMLIAVLCVGAVVAGNRPQADYDIHLIVAHDPPPPYYMQSMKQFADEVESGTDGHVRVQVLTSRQYGSIDMLELTRALAAGKFEMSAATTNALGYVNPDFWAYEMPYLFQSYGHVERVIDGPVGQRLLDSLTPSGIRGLAYTYSGGYKVVASTTGPLRTPADFRGKRVLTHDPVNVQTFRDLGARVHEGSYRESRPLMAAGKVQATEMTYTRYAEYGVVSKYVTELDHSFFLTTMLINESFYNKLPPAYREVVSRAARRVALVERARTIQENQRIREKLAARGVRVVTLTEAEKEKFRKATRAVYAQCARYFSVGLVEQMAAAPVAAR